MSDRSSTKPRISASEAATVARLAERHGFSADAVRVMAAAIARGNRAMAQFDHPEFGGHGQWMRGGMLMIGDMFNHGLKARVGALCDELSSAALPETTATSTRGSFDDWWPGNLGRPESSGGQNGIRYAYFAGQRRLVIERDGGVETYDTGDHRISGVAQQQSHRTSLTFTSQSGLIDLERLRRI